MKQIKLILVITAVLAGAGLILIHRQTIMNYFRINKNVDNVKIQTVPTGQYAQQAQAKLQKGTKLTTAASYIPGTNGRIVANFVKHQRHKAE